MKLGMDTPWDPGSDMGYIRLRFAARTLGSKEYFFFFHFYAFKSISSRFRHTFFSKIFVIAKRKTRNLCDRSEQDASAKRGSEATENVSAKPEGAK